MEKFRSSTSFSTSTSVNCVSNGGNVLSPTTIDHLPVNRAMSVSPSHGTQSAVQQRGFSSSGHEGTRVPEMAGNEESVSSKLEASISPDAKQKVESLLADVRKLGEKEKLWLYLQLPSGNQEQEASCKSSSPMLSSSRVEQTTAINWVRSHIEESADTSLPKKEVYEEYRSFCENSNHRALSTADFGKVIKGVFPMVQARRLGTRGNSRYCYSGVKKKTDLTSPSLSLLDAPAIKPGSDILQGQCTNCPASLCSMDDDHLQLAAAQVICEWASNVTSKPFTDFVELAQHLTSNKLVTRCSKSILIVQSHMAENFRHDLTPEMRHRETNYHLKQALQYRQEARKKQAEENQQRLQGVLSPAQFKQQVTTGSSEDLTIPHASQTDKATQLEQRDVNTVRDGPGGTSSSSYVAEGNDTSTNVENNMSSSNTSGESNSSSKESPGKRRFAPIQPKTPVRDTNPAQMVLISPSAKSNGQQFQLLVLKGQQAVPMQGVQKLPNQQQMNVLLQGQNVFSSPVQTVAAVGSQTPVNVVQPVGNQIVGNAVLSSQVIPATSIQNVIKSGQVVIVGSQVKNLQGVCGGYKTVTNTNAAIQQSPGQNVAPNQVALVAQAVPPQPNTVVPTTNVACQKTVLSSQGIAFNTGTSNTRSQNVTPVFLERTLSSVATSDSSPVAKLTSANTTPVRTTVSSLVPVQNTQSVVTNGQSSLPTTVTFATQPMKLPSPVLINPEPFQGNNIPIQTNTVDQNRQVTGQTSIASPSVQFGKLDKAQAVGRIVKGTVNISATELMRSMSSSGKTGMTQNGGGKTVATLLSQRSAQTITSRTSSPLTSSSSLLSPKEATTSTLVNLPGNVVLAQVQMPAQNLQSQHEQNKLAQLVVHSGREEPALGNDSNVTSANSAEIGIGRQDLTPQQSSILSGIILQQNGGKQLLAGNNNIVPIQQMAVDETSGILGPDVAQPSISLLPDADTSANTMLTVSGMSAAMMLPHKSKPEQLSQVSNLPQSQSTVAINNQSMDSHPGTAPCSQSTKVALFNPNDSVQPKMLERLLASEDLSYFGSSVPKEVRSVPTTPIPELPAVVHMVRAQSAANPMQQGSESIPPSPSDGKSFSFTPISTVELDGGESPRKLRFKPKPTHPITSNILHQVLMNATTPDQGQDVSAGGKGKGKRQQQSEFVTPTRKRRPSSSSKRPPTTSPVSLQYQLQQQQLRQNMTSPAPKQMISQQPTFLLQSAQPGSNIQMPSSSIQLVAPTGSILAAGGQSQQAMWQRRRNPSGPACTTINTATQEAIETELRNFLQNSANASDLQAIMAANKRVLQNRSQSVPLPEQPANRLLGLPLTSQYATQQDYLPSQSDMVATQVMPAMTADQARQIQTVQLNSYSAKRNLNQGLLDLEVTEADFEPCNALLNDHIGASSTNIQQMNDLSTQSWSAGQEESAIVVPENGADYQLKYDIPQRRETPTEIAESQNLFAEQSFNDTSNSTASSIGESMMMDELPENMFQEMGEEQGCDLPLTPWQMGTRNTSLSTLECGM